MSINNKHFMIIAFDMVPKLRRIKADIERSGIDTAGVSESTQALVKVDGVESRVRITVELDPTDRPEDA